MTQTQHREHGQRRHPRGCRRDTVGPDLPVGYDELLTQLKGRGCGPPGYEPPVLSTPRCWTCIGRSSKRFWTGRRARVGAQLILGDNLDTERIVASYDGGVLSLRIPVAEQAKPRKIGPPASWSWPGVAGPTANRPIPEELSPPWNRCFYQQYASAAVRSRGPNRLRLPGSVSTRLELPRQIRAFRRSISSNERFVHQMQLEDRDEGKRRPSHQPPGTHLVCRKSTVQRAMDDDWLLSHVLRSASVLPDSARYRLRGHGGVSPTETAARAGCVATSIAVHSCSSDSGLLFSILVRMQADGHYQPTAVFAQPARLTCVAVLFMSFQTPSMRSRA